MTIDRNNRRTQVIRKVNGITFTEYTVYDEVGNIIETKDGENHSTTYGYDDSNRRIKTLDPLNHATLTDYDSLSERLRQRVGNIVKTTDALARITKSEYDQLNRQTAITQAFDTTDTTTTHYTYDNVGNLIAETDGRHNTLPLVPTTKYTYDALGHRTSHQTYCNDDRLHTSVAVGWALPTSQTFTERQPWLIFSIERSVIVRLDLFE